MAQTTGKVTAVGAPRSVLTAWQQGVKFRFPAEPDDVVVRRRLLDLLQRGAELPLTLLSAPAGYGKTVLVSSWLTRARRDSTPVQLTLDEDDENPTGFWTSAVESWHRAGVDVSGIRVGSGSHVIARSTLMELARCVTAHGTSVIWVVDCDEWSLAPELGQDLHRLVELCGGLLRLVLLTRTDPPLPLHRYRLDGAVAEIRAADLAFIATEISTLLQSSGLELGADDVAALLDRTGGWPAGVRFAAMTLARRRDTGQAIQDFRGDRGNVAEYLMSEVLDRQSPELREFLLRTCIVDELSPGLVEALTGQYCDDRVLRFLSHGNAFIEGVPGQRDRYRYQSLFREFLRSQVSYERPGLVTQLHEAASSWFESDGQPLLGVRHAAVAEAWPQAARVLVDGIGIGALLAAPRRNVLHMLLSGLPDDCPGDEAAVVRAALAILDLDPARCAAQLASVGVEPTTATAGATQACALAVSVLDALVASVAGDADDGLVAALAAESALHLSPTHEPAWTELAVVVAGCKGRALLERGEIEEALAAISSGIELAWSAGLDHAAAELEGLAALTHAMTGSLRLATETAIGAAGSGSGAPRTPPVARGATVALAWVRMDQYDPGAAQSLLEDAEAQAPTFNARVVGAALALVRARLLVAQGDDEGARVTLQTARTYAASAHRPGWIERLLELEEKRTAGNGADLDELLESCEVLPHDVRVAHLLEQAASAWETGRPDEAEGHLRAALRLAALEDLRRPFMEAAPVVQGLLARTRAPELVEGRRWLDASASAAIGDGRRPSTARLTRQARRNSDDTLSTPLFVDPLTPKEQEVLGFLAELLTTEEIAEAMFVSVNTVRSHVRSILRKLGVTRRNQAVRRAWDLGLLQPHPAGEPAQHGHPGRLAVASAGPTGRGVA